MADAKAPQPAAPAVAVDRAQLAFGTEFEAEEKQQEVMQHDSTREASGGRPSYLIREVTLKNFRGFEEFSLKLSHFNVLVGANNTGKSTLLRTVRFAYELTRMHYYRDKGGKAEFFPGRSVPKSLLPVAQLRDLWPGGRMRTGNVWKPSEVGIRFEGGQRLSFAMIGPWNAVNSRITADEMPSAMIEDFLSHPPEFVPASIGIVAEEEYRTPARRGALVSTGRHNEILRNYLIELQERGVLGELSRVLEKYFGAGIEVPTFDPQKDQFIVADYSGAEGDHDLYSAGGGFLQILEVLAFILRGNPGVVLLDEPDSHLNSALQHAFIDILEEIAERLGFQVVLATHSKEIINYVDPSRLIPIDRHLKEAQPLQSHVGTVTVLKELGAIDNVDAYQIVKQKALLIVEGPTDRELLPRLAAKLGSTIFDGDARVSIIVAKGVDRLTDESQLAVIETMLGGPVKVLLVRDRDGLTDAWKAELEKRAKRSAFIWPQDQIENYLLMPPAIHRILVEELAGGAPAVGDVEKLIADTVMGHKDIVVDRISARVQELEWKYNNNRVDAAKANPIARAEVARRWKDIGSALGLANGKTVLADVRTAIQTKWKVSFGNARIIEAMTKEEIHPDVVTLVERAGKELGASKTRKVERAVVPEAKAKS